MHQFKFALVTFTMVTAHAVYSEAYAASCLEEPTKVGDAEITTFISKPNDLLAPYPVGGLDLSNRIRGLVASSSDTLDTAAALASTANSDQNKSIGAGLARAVAVCAKTQPGYADRIQQVVASLGNPELIAAFAAATQDIRTASIGAGGVGVGGGATGTLGGTWAENTYEGIGDSTSRISPFTFSVSVSRQAPGSGT